MGQTRQFLGFLERISALRDESQPLVEVVLNSGEDSNRFCFHLTGKFSPSIDRGDTGEPSLTIEADAEHFFELCEHGDAADWRSAAEAGELSFEGDEDLAGRLLDSLESGATAASQ